MAEGSSSQILRVKESLEKNLYRELLVRILYKHLLCEKRSQQKDSLNFPLNILKYLS